LRILKRAGEVAGPSPDGGPFEEELRIPPEPLLQGEIQPAQGFLPGLVPLAADLELPGEVSLGSDVSQEDVAVGGVRNQSRIDLQRRLQVRFKRFARPARLCETG